MKISLLMTGLGSAIAAYCFFPKKSAIDVSSAKKRRLTLFLSYIEFTWDKDLEAIAVEASGFSCTGMRLM